MDETSSDSNGNVGLGKKTSKPTRIVKKRKNSLRPTGITKKSTGTPKPRKEISRIHPIPRPLTVESKLYFAFFSPLQWTSMRYVVTDIILAKLHDTVREMMVAFGDVKEPTDKSVLFMQELVIQYLNAISEKVSDWMSCTATTSLIESTKTSCLTQSDLHPLLHASVVCTNRTYF